MTELYMNYKKDFPIFINNPGLVYLDSAATSQKPQVVIDAISEFYSTYNANIHRGLYSIAEKATEKVEEVREKVSKFIHAKDSSQVAFTHGTTEALNILASDFKKGYQDWSEIIISEMEHHSNFVPWQKAAEEKKASLLFFAMNKNGELDNTIVDEHGNIRYDNDFNTMVHFGSVSLTHVSNVVGTINPIEKIFGKMLHEVDAITSTRVVDAAQSVPHMPIDVQQIDCDYLVFSGHKMLAPTGVGILYGEDAFATIDPLILGSQMIEKVDKFGTTFAKGPQKLEPGTLPIEGIIGLGAAIDYLQDIGMKHIREHEKNLTKYCLEQMEKIAGLTVYGPKDTEKRSGVISFNLDGIHSHDVAQVLADMNICIRAGHHCAMPLHNKLGISSSVRTSFYLYNDEEDIDKLIKGIKKAKKLFK